MKREVFAIGFAIAFVIVMAIVAVNQWLGNYDYWCPNESGTLMEHHVVVDYEDNVVDSYPLPERMNF